jgi:hypothetical protein
MPDASMMAANLEGAESKQGSTLFDQSQSLQSTLKPFYQNEMSNPQGMGATTMAQMLTQSGQGVAGAVGAQKKAGLDMAARTGNTAAIPSMMGGDVKAGMAQQGAAANNIAVQNAQMKQQQQQQGASGLSDLFSQNIGKADSFENSANDAIKTRIQAQQAAEQEKQAMFGDAMKLGGAVMTGGASMAMGGGAGGAMGAMGGAMGG